MYPTLARTNGHHHHLLLLLLLSVADFAVAQQQQPPASQGYPTAHISQPMAIVIVVLIAAFFFLGFFSIYIRHCYGDSTGSLNYTFRPGGTALASAARSRRQRGLDPAVLETFPTMAYADVKAHKASKGALECAVCLSEFDDDETLRLLPKCSHVFHQDCIDAWLASHVTCPVCRANLVPHPDTPATSAPPTEQAQEAAPSMQASPAVVIDVEETEEDRIIREEAAELMRIGSLKRALHSKSGRPPAQFPRSHSTGHSLTESATAAGGAAERFTLKLPDNVLREIIKAGKLRRTTSLLAFRAGGQGSTRRSFRAGGEGTTRAGRSIRFGQSGRWPSFLKRTLSARLPAWGSARRGDVDGSSTGGNGKVADVGVAV